MCHCQSREINASSFADIFQKTAILTIFMGPFAPKALLIQPFSTNTG
jgi:hypothetical protein